MNDHALPGLYIHVPFCGSKCPYCDFYSITSMAQAPRWLEALDREAMHYRDRFSVFDSLYLGGGTPSLLDEKALTALTEGLLRCFTFTSGAEWTIECNPDDIIPGKAALLRDLGFNRISLGVQSFDDGELRLLQRRHTSDQAVRALEAFLGLGFKNIGIDLMYALPGQSESSWLATLNRALDLGPTHISCYELTLAEGTPFAEMNESGQLKTPEPELQRAFFLMNTETIAGHGYIHYEVSNFARDEGSMCRHNIKYWNRLPYLGLGPSAHSFAEGKRWWNVECVSGYCDALSNDRLPVEDCEILSQDQEHLETLALGFRTKEGVAEGLLHHRLHAGRIINDLRGSGLIRCKNGRIIPTPEGFLVADRLPLLFC